MPFEIDTVTAPAFWASALVNGDRSGLSDEDEAALDAQLARWKAMGIRVVDVVRDEDGNPQEPRFTWQFSLHGGTAQGGDVLDYVAHCYPVLTSRRSAAAIRAKLSGGLLERYQAARTLGIVPWSALDVARHGKPVKAAPVVEYTKQREPGRYFIQGALRDAGTWSDLNRGRNSHGGWYLSDDNITGETVAGLAVLLPHGRYLAAYQFSYESSEGGRVVDTTEIFTDELEAARRGDQLAEFAAEQERDYNRAWQAGLEYAELAEDIKKHRRFVLGLLREFRSARGERLEGQDYELTCRVIRERIESILEDIKQARARRAKLQDDFATYHGSAFSDGAACY